MAPNVGFVRRQPFGTASPEQAFRQYLEFALDQTDLASLSLLKRNRSGQFNPCDLITLQAPRAALLQSCFVGRNMSGAQRFFGRVVFDLENGWALAAEIPTSGV